MRISILNRNNNDNYKKEYQKMIKVLTSKCITVHNKKETYFDFINKVYNEVVNLLNKQLEDLEV